MLKGFEDAFVDVQASVISLCLELLSNSGRTAEKIYTTNDWFPAEKISDFFDCGVEDIEKLIDICNAYDSKCPHELKLIYNVVTKSFDSEYNYENIIDIGEKSVVELAKDWFDDCDKNITK